MLGLYRAVFLIFFLDIYVKCALPTLSVNKVNMKLVEKKRKDTLELCRMFNEENGKLVHSKHLRAKRAVASMEEEQRVESIVDRLYDDQVEDGERVTYRQRSIRTTTPKGRKDSGRRLDFAPGLLESSLVPVGDDGDPGGVNESSDLDTAVDWHKRWKYGIVPFFIDPKTYDYYLAEKIIKAFEHVEHSTCIRLQRLRTKPTDEKSLKNVEWLYITNPSGTRQCVHTNENKTIAGVQMVLFGYDCMSQGEIVHELLHILGFPHEHVRKDRDRYISVIWDNIKPGYKKFFEMRDTDKRLLTVPYDYASVLHYPPRAFSKNGKYTIMVEPGVKIGQRTGLSELDIEKVSKIFGNECMNRNKEYLMNTCDTVVSMSGQENQNVSREEIEEYFKNRLWPDGVVNFKLRDSVEFTIEERENIKAVIKHIEQETCIKFNDLTKYNEKSTIHHSLLGNTHINDIEDDDDNKIDSDKSTTTAIDTTNSTTLGDSSGQERKSEKEAVNSDEPSFQARRDSSASHVYVLSRAKPDPACICPEPGRPDAVEKKLMIGLDCFNSVNDLLHLFVHVLGLDHQHNMHDRDSFLAINFTLATEDVKKEMERKLPAAASVGFSYDYQSVMHYPWLQIKDGVSNFIYPIWNDGWVMGHWQGLSSVDVQKINQLYFEQCQSREEKKVRAKKEKKGEKQ